MRPVRKADNLTTILCRCHINLGTLTSWNPLGHSRRVMGVLYLCFVIAEALEHIPDSEMCKIFKNYFNNIEYSCC